MTGFPIKSLIDWMNGRFGVCTVEPSHIQEAAPNANGELAVVAGSEKVFLKIKIVSDGEMFYSDTVQVEVLHRLQKLGAKKAVAFGMKMSRHGNRTFCYLTYVLGKIDLV